MRKMTSRKRSGGLTAAEVAAEDTNMRRTRMNKRYKNNKNRNMKKKEEEEEEWDTLVEIRRRK